MGDLAHVWYALIQPLSRLLIGLALGLLVANVLESMRWTRHLARLAAPLARCAHLREAVAAAFAMAFVSPTSANALLAQSHAIEELHTKELILANLFNSLPAYLVHIPTIFFLTWPVLGWPACVYVGLTLLAAAGRTVFTIGLARLLLPKPDAGCAVCSLANTQPDTHNAGQSVPIRSALHKAWGRFVRRLPRLVSFTVPIYCVMYFLQIYGFFQTMEGWLANNAAWLTFMKPQAFGIVVLHLAAELGAALSAAGSVLHSGGLSERDIVVALLVGNILSTPVRALRHQLPSYAGFFRPAIAMQLIVSNQSLRAASLVLVTIGYYWCTM